MRAKDICYLCVVDEENDPLLQPHPIADLFPLIEGDEFAALVGDIQQNGLNEPIVLFEGKILDGRNRYRAMREIDPGVSPETAPRLFVQFDDDDPLRFCLSKNLHRRHLSTSQRALLAAKIVGDVPNGNQWTRGRNLKDAAAMMNVARNTVYAARELMKREPEAAAEIALGKRRIGAYGDRRSQAVNFTKAEFARCKAAAERARTPMTTWIHRRVMEAIERSEAADQARGGR